jgi:hypothetical protein
MTRKCNVSSFLLVVVLLVTSHLGFAQSVLSGPMAQGK